MRSPAVLLFFDLFAAACGLRPAACGSSDVSDSGGTDSTIPDGPFGGILPPAIGITEPAAS
jgi:hypothetical protein